MRIQQLLLNQKYNQTITVTLVPMVINEKTIIVSRRDTRHLKQLILKFR